MRKPNPIKKEIVEAERAFDLAFNLFERTFRKSAKKCEYQKRILYRVGFSGKEYYALSCELKDEPHEWGCTYGSCPYINKGLRLKGGKVS
jgi:hypothetical protein